MIDTLIYLSKSNSFIVSFIGFIGGIFPVILFTVILIRHARIWQTTLIYKAFKFPKDIKEYKKIKNKLKILIYIFIQILAIYIIYQLLIWFYLIYYGICIPKLYDIKAFW